MKVKQQFRISIRNIKKIVFILCFLFSSLFDIHTLSTSSLFVLLFYFSKHYLFNISIHHHRNAKHTDLNRMCVQFKVKINLSCAKSNKYIRFYLFVNVFVLFCFVFSVSTCLAEWLCDENYSIARNKRHF